jgi:hypothetical protein
MMLVRAIRSRAYIPKLLWIPTPLYSSTNPRSLSSGAGTFVTESAEYNKVMIRKFIFQIHPDFFESFKTEQSINATNLKILQSKSSSQHQQRQQATTANGSDRNQQEQDDSINADGSITPRNLIFYIKPTKEDVTPRKVKISMNRVFDSIRDILETMGEELPPKPEGSAPSADYVSSAGLDEFMEFVSSLIDRYYTCERNIYCSPKLTSEIPNINVGKN